MDENIRGNILEEEPVVFADHTKIDGTAVASTERVALLILGMHRSGTSALARVLSLAGATLPQQVLGTGEGNETGHWEPRRIALLNDELMRSLNHSWFDWRGLDLTSLPFQARRDFYQDIRTILREEYGEATLVVLKEPRTCRMAEVYINALQDIGFSPLPIIIFRNPLEVVASLMARSGWPENRAPVDAALLWLVHVLDAEHATRGTNRIFWPYEALFDDWREFLLLLQSGHNVNLPVASDVLSYQIEMFLDTKKRHQRRQSSDLSDDPVTMGWIRETYDALLQLKVNPNSDHATRTLDRIRSILQSSMPLLEQSLKERDAVFSLLTNSRTAASDAEARNLEQERRLNEARAATEALSEAHRQERAAHEDEIQAMLQSRSWKMTAPFRDLRRTAGKLIDRVNVARAAVDARGGGGADCTRNFRHVAARGLQGCANAIGFRRFGHAAPTAV